MGPLLALVSPCFRENLIVTCKVLPFLCSLDNFLQKMYLVFFLLLLFFFCFYFRKSNFKMALFDKKRATFDLLFTFLSPSERHKFLWGMSHSHTYTHFAHPIDFFAFPILQKLLIHHVWFLFGVTFGVNSYFRRFAVITK